MCATALEPARPRVVCLAPVRNEAWILDLFLRAASLWADAIVVSDQMSSDGSRGIVRRFPKAHLVHYDSPDYHEAHHRRFLIAAARRLFPGTNVLVALDADELLTATVFDSAEWETVIRASPGTAIRLDWVNLRPGFESGWQVRRPPCAVVDDGTVAFVEPNVLHSWRVPIAAGAPVVDVKDVRIMHYQYVDRARVRAKHAWYQCFERLLEPAKSAATIYREYHHMNVVVGRVSRQVHASAFLGYISRGVDPRALAFNTSFWWDTDVLDLFDRAGTAHFAREAIWDRDWVDLARTMGRPHPERYADPRSWRHSLVQRYLRISQPFSGWRLARAPDAVLRRFGW